jgi:hypothetical protein
MSRVGSRRATLRAPPQMIADAKFDRLPFTKDEDLSYNISRELRPVKRDTDNGSLFSQMLKEEKVADNGSLFNEMLTGEKPKNARNNDDESSEITSMKYSEYSSNNFLKHQEEIKR